MRYASDSSHALQMINKGCRDHAQGVSEHLAVIDDMGKVRGVASIYPALEVRLCCARFRPLFRSLAD